MPALIVALNTSRILQRVAGVLDQVQGNEVECHGTVTAFLHLFAWKSFCW